MSPDEVIRTIASMDPGKADADPVDSCATLQTLIGEAQALMKAGRVPPAPGERPPGWTDPRTGDARKALAKWERAADGSHADSEHKAGCDLAEELEHLIEVVEGQA